MVARLLRRSCADRNEQGAPCRQAPLVDSDHCYWHDPRYVEEAKEARCLGGQRRKREVTLAGAYDLSGLSGLDQARRYLEIAGFDTLALDNGVVRNRLLVAVALGVLKLVEVDDHEQRLVRLEQATTARMLPASAFGVDPEEAR